MQLCSVHNKSKPSSRRQSFLSLKDAEAFTEQHLGICQRRRQVQQKRQGKTRRKQDDKNCQVDGHLHLHKGARRLHDTVQ